MAGASAAKQKGQGGNNPNFGKSMPQSPNLGFIYSSSTPGNNTSFTGYNDSFYNTDKNSEKGGRDNATDIQSEIISNTGNPYESKKYDKGDKGEKNMYRPKTEKYDRREKYNKRKKPGPGGNPSQGRNENVQGEDYESGEENANYYMPPLGTTSKNSLPGSTVGQGNGNGKKSHERGEKQVREFKREDRNIEIDSRREEINHRLKDVPQFHHEVGPTVNLSSQRFGLSTRATSTSRRRWSTKTT